MKKILIMIICLGFTGCVITKVQNISVENSSNTKIEGNVKGSDPSDSLNGNKGSIKVPLVP